MASAAPRFAMLRPHARPPADSPLLHPDKGRGPDSFYGRTSSRKAAR